MKLCEFETYKSVYCGLCKSMGREFGFWSRFTLSYDFTFLTILAMSVSPDLPEIGVGRCVFNPMKKINICHENKELVFSGDVAMLMLWHKLQDNKVDGGFWEKTISTSALFFVKKSYQKSYARNTQLGDVMATCMEDQKKLEQAQCSELDRICHPSAHLLGSVTETLSQDSGQKRVLYRLGYLLGRYVYISDALDDLEQDEKAKGYNPLLLRETLSPLADEDIRTQAKGSLFMTIAEIGNTYELLETHKFEPILTNILYMGLRENVDQIVIPHTDRCKGCKKR